MLVASDSTTDMGNVSQVGYKFHNILLIYILHDALNS
jgi:hypothetical protein